MTRAERILAPTLVAIAVTACSVLSGHVPVPKFVVLGWLGILAVSAYLAYIVSSYDATESDPS